MATPSFLYNPKVKQRKPKVSPKPSMDYLGMAKGVKEETEDLKTSLQPYEFKSDRNPFAAPPEAMEKPKKKMTMKKPLIKKEAMSKFKMLKKETGEEKIQKAYEERKDIIGEKQGILEKIKQTEMDAQEKALEASQERRKIEQKVLDTMEETRLIPKTEMQRTQQRYMELRRKREEVFNQIQPVERKKLINASTPMGALLEGIIKVGFAALYSDAVQGPTNEYVGENSFMSHVNKSIEDDYRNQIAKQSELGRLLKMYQEELGNEAEVINTYKAENLQILGTKIQYAMKQEEDINKQKEYQQAIEQIGLAQNQISQEQNNIDLTQAERQAQKETQEMMQKAQFQLEQFKQMGRMKEMQFEANIDIMKKQQDHIFQLEKQRREQEHDIKIQSQEDLAKLEREEFKQKGKVGGGSGFDFKTPKGIIKGVPMNKDADKNMRKNKDTIEKNAATFKEIFKALKEFEGGVAEYTKRKIAGTLPLPATEKEKRFRTFKQSMLQRLKATIRIDTTGGGNVSEYEQKLLNQIIGSELNDIVSGVTRGNLMNLLKSQKAGYEANIRNSINFKGLSPEEKEKTIKKIVNQQFKGF